MELPADEDDDENVMGMSEVLEIGTSPFLHGKVNHDGKADGHNPPGSAGPGGKVGPKESNEPRTTCLCGGFGKHKLGKVDHVCHDMHDNADNNGPGGGLMDGGVLVEGN
jgi:hypothetical protein